VSSPSGSRLVAIDLGTTTCKAAVYVAGRLVASGSERLTTSYPAPGEAEQDPDSWVTATRATVQLALAKAGVTSVDAIGLTAESDTLVLVDAEGDAVRPALLWMDARGGAEARQLSESMGGDEIYARTGLRSSFNFTFPKAAWTRVNEPQSFRRARWLMQPKDFLFRWLTGEALTDPSSASRTLGFDARAGAWSPSILHEFQLPERMLPALVSSSSASRPLGRVGALSLGLPRGTPVVIGAADRAAEALGVAASSERAMISSGTATGVAVTMPFAAFTNDDRIITPHHALAGELLALASIPTSGAVVEWLAGLSRGPSAAATARLLNEAARTPPGARGAVSILSFTGARSLQWQPEARGAILGLELGITRADLARSIIEAVGQECRAIISALSTRLTHVTEVVLTGGLHRSDFVCQTMADITGLSAVRYAERDAALAGAMLLASASVESIDDVRAAAHKRLGRGKRFAPDPSRQEIYDGLASRYDAAMRASLAFAAGATGA
jgi:xylulokinase